MQGTVMKKIINAELLLVTFFTNQQLCGCSLLARFEM